MYDFLLDFHCKYLYLIPFPRHCHLSTPKLKCLLSCILKTRWGLKEVRHVIRTMPSMGKFVIHKLVAMINMCTKFQDFSFTSSKHMQEDPKFENMSALKWLQSFNVIGTVTIWHSIYDLLFTFHGNHAPIVHHFQDKAC